MITLTVSLLLFSSFTVVTALLGKDSQFVSFNFFSSEVTIGFNGTYSVREDGGSINIFVLVLMNSLARDVVVTFSTQDNTTSGRFTYYLTCMDHYYFIYSCLCSWDGLQFCIYKFDI